MAFRSKQVQKTGAKNKKKLNLRIYLLRPDAKLLTFA